MPISSVGRFKLICSSKLRISIPNIFISCEKLSQFFTPPTIPFFTTFVPYPFFRTRSPSNTSLLIACLNVFLEMCNCSDNSTSFGNSFPFLYSSDSMSLLSISSAWIWRGLSLLWSIFISIRIGLFSANIRFIKK